MSRSVSRTPPSAAARASSWSGMRSRFARSGVDQPADVAHEGAGDLDRAFAGDGQQVSAHADQIDEDAHDEFALACKLTTAAASVFFCTDGCGAAQRAAAALLSGPNSHHASQRWWGEALDRCCIYADEYRSHHYF